MDDDLKLQKVIDEYKQTTSLNCYALSLTKTNPSILEDKIGGKPYLPLGQEYPKDSSGYEMGLLLQVNLENINLDNWPKEGILEIFCQRGYDYPTEYAIKYFASGLEYQIDLPEINTNDFFIEKSFGFNLKKVITHMPLSDNRSDNIFSKLFNKEFGTNFTSIFEIEDYLKMDIFSEITNNISVFYCTIGGYADFVQYDYRKENDLRTTTIFKIDSCIDSENIFIGDNGILCVIIDKQSLINKNFAKATLDWDCY